MTMKIYFAPLQGYTEGIYRKAHHLVYGGIERYYTPFLRMEKGEPRRQDMGRLLSDTNGGVPVSPQVIFNDREELESLVGTAYSYGYRSIDLNMGCPFPPQMKLGRGSALLERPDVLREILPVFGEFDGMEYTLKMRLGVNDTTAWRGVIDILNRMPLSHITVHPRSAKQQYKGELDMAQFEELLKASAHPVIYNGELRTADDIHAITERIPGIAGVMIGRGLLARPSLAAEYAEGEEWDYRKRREHLMRMHEMVYRHNVEKLCGETQTLSHLTPFWDYLEDEIGRKAWKRIRKATTLQKYREAIALI